MKTDILARIPCLLLWPFVRSWLWCWLEFLCFSFSDIFILQRFLTFVELGDIHVAIAVAVADAIRLDQDEEWCDAMT